MKASEWGEQGTDQIPLSYLYQVAYYSAICGVDRVDIAVLIGGQDFRMYTYLKNEDLESKLIKAANAFWNNYIAKGIAPEATTQGDISTLYPNSNGETLEADDEITKEIEELKEIKEKEKELLKLKSDKETKIKACMGFKEAIIAGDGSLLATWKNGKSRKMLDTKKLKIENALIYQQYLNTKEASRMFLVK
jgi:predicted phage-related endonuclease